MNEDLTGVDTVHIPSVPPMLFHRCDWCGEWWETVREGHIHHIDTPRPSIEIVIRFPLGYDNEAKGDMVSKVRIEFD